MSISLELEAGKLKLTGFRRLHILIVGAGGTGSYVIAHLGRFLSYLKKIMPDLSITITIADGDSFEEKNKERQVCYNADLDKNKARVQARKIGNLFGLNCFYYDRYIEDVKKCVYLLKSPGYYYDSLSILIGNVDNNGTRQILHETFLSKDPQNVVYIDSGNNDKAGQVVFGLKLNGEVALPPVGYYHPEIITDKQSPVPSQQSCAQRMEQTPQAMMANVWASTIVMSMLTNLLEQRTVDTIVSYFNSHSINVRPHVTVEKFLANYAASFYYHNNLRNWLDRYHKSIWKVTDELNLLGYDPDYEVVKDLHGRPGTVTLAVEGDPGLKFTLLAVTDTGKELRLVPNLTDDKGLTITGAPIEVNMGWQAETRYTLRQRWAEYLRTLVDTAGKAYSEPGDQEANVTRALAGLHGKVDHKPATVINLKTAA